MTTKTERAKLESAQAKIATTKMTLLKYMEEQAEIIDTYISLRQDYEAAIETAKTLYRDHVEELGDAWAGFSARHTILLDAEALRKGLGKAAEPLIEVKYVVRRDRYNEAVNEGRIPKAVMAAVETGVQTSIVTPKL